MRLSGAAMGDIPVQLRTAARTPAGLAAIRPSLVSGRPLLIRRTSAIGTNLVSLAED